jgi:hypothetical protein
MSNMENIRRAERGRERGAVASGRTQSRYRIHENEGKYDFKKK